MPKKLRAARDAVLHVRLPKREKTNFESAAARSGFSLSTWVRMSLRKAAGVEK